MPGIPRPHWTSPQLPSASSFCNTGANNDSHGSVGQGSSGYLTNRWAEKLKISIKDEDIDFRCLPALVEVKVVDQEGARRLLSDFSLNNNDHSRNQVVQPSCQVVNIVIRWSESNLVAQAFSLEVVKKAIGPSSSLCPLTSSCRDFTCYQCVKIRLLMWEKSLTWLCSRLPWFTWIYTIFLSRAVFIQPYFSPQLSLQISI